MPSLGTWVIEYYQTVAGSVPVAEFVDTLSPQAKAKFIRSLELLEQYGLLLREPWVRSIQDISKLRELRFISFGDIYRFFFFRELQTAEARMKDYMQRQGGKL